MVRMSDGRVVALVFSGASQPVVQVSSIGRVDVELPRLNPCPRRRPPVSSPRQDPSTHLPAPTSIKARCYTTAPMIAGASLSHKLRDSPNRKLLALRKRNAMINSQSLALPSRTHNEEVRAEIPWLLRQDFEAIRGSSRISE